MSWWKITLDLECWETDLCDEARWGPTAYAALCSLLDPGVWAGEGWRSTWEGDQDGPESEGLFLLTSPTESDGMAQTNPAGLDFLMFCVTFLSYFVEKHVKPVHPKGDQSWMFIGRTDVEAETPILWPPDAKSWLIGKDPDAGRDWGQEEKGTTEDEMVGWHHRLNGHGSGWTPAVGDGQGSLACWDSWGRKESDTTERLNWTKFRESFYVQTLLV